MPPSQSPLRRLSVALRLKEVYAPATPATPTTRTTANSLSVFLSKAKANFLADVKEDPAMAAEKWTVVMGNEAGDLDTLASSIAYAWLESEVNLKPTVPLIQLERGDFTLRAENLYALELCGLSKDQEELLTFSDVSDFMPFPSHKFALVDHNRMADAYMLNNPQAQVVAVLDHHADEGLYLHANPRIISDCGSCASHVVSYITSHVESQVANIMPPEVPPELASLLLTAILIDTDGLKPGGKAIDLDRESAMILAHKSTIADSIPPDVIDSPNPNALYETQAIKDLTKVLDERKSDVSHLAAFDLLRRDYKEDTYTLTWAAGQPTIKGGLSTVPSRLKLWGSNGRLEKDVVTWMQRRGLTILGVLTSFRDVKQNILINRNINKKGKHKREMAWIILEEPALSSTSNSDLTTEILARRLWTGLERSELDVTLHPKFQLNAGKLPLNAKSRVYKQGNASASRKIIAPLLKDILEGTASPYVPGGSNREIPAATSV